MQLRHILVPVLKTALFLLLLLLVPPSNSESLSTDLSALLSFRSALRGRTLSHWNNTAAASPCSWPGIQCSSSSSPTGQRVVSLRLPAASLSSAIPDNTLSNLTALRTLSLRFNFLPSPLPSDFSRLSSLRNLYLRSNRFSGPIPDSVLSLPNLVRLDLSENHFSGPIPSAFGNLTRLRTLFLQGNSLSGNIPKELTSSPLEQFNVSGNSLNGSIPEGLAKFGVSAFAGNDLCGKPLALVCSEDISLPTGTAAGGNSSIFGGGSGGGGSGKRKGKLSGGAIAGIAIGCVLGFLLLLALLVCLCRSKWNKKSRSVNATAAAIKDLEFYAVKDDEKRVAGLESGGSSYANQDVYSVGAMQLPKGGGELEVNGGFEKKLVFFGNSRAKAFDLEDLLRASAEVLGKGTYGTTYKAILEDGTMVAVKRLKDVNVPASEYKEKIEAIGRMENENLGSLMAYYYSNDEKLLVYEYMPMGSLSALLHGNKGASRTPLNWETRAAIALGAARGVEYLHSQDPSTSHGNIKSSNILLTTKHDARVSDFGLASLAGSSASSTPNRVAGYRAPEVTDPRKVSQKADVYSFGVLLLELLTGKAPTHSLLNEEGIDLPRWVQSVVCEEWSSEVFDLDLLRQQAVEEEMVRLLQLGVDCTAQYPDNRPPMSEVRRQIEEICGGGGQLAGALEEVKEVDVASTL
ncbi:hypothetical protein MLD38_031616 [Melastoma candidum]|uniref:Uncharacterized protein n=1 Tax=Melastoma candidum TaxID=119954 RepID=A0ACB9MQ14_9MYRT|nr:hypothetical protein MLD38_031616 [Melastoma candidum]